MPEMWRPRLGEDVWLNYDGQTEPLGRVVCVSKVGAIFHPGDVVYRAKDGTHHSIHSMFLLPFRLGGPEWQQAVAEGRVV